MFLSIPLFYYHFVEFYQTFMNNDTKIFYILYYINIYCVKNKDMRISLEVVSKLGIGFFKKLLKVLIQLFCFNYKMYEK